MESLVPTKQYGLVFSGGGSKGAYEIGAWRALRELGIDRYINGVSGSSIGAFNTALFMQGDLERAENLWRELTKGDFINLNFEKIIGKIADSRNSGGYKETFLQNVDLIGTGEKAKQLAARKLDSLLNGRWESDSARNYAVWFAQNLFGDGFATPEKLISILRANVDFSSCNLDKMDLFSTVCSWDPNTQVSGVARYCSWRGLDTAGILGTIACSMALPVLYPHGERESEYFVDGGYADNIPIRPLYEIGYRDIIVIYLDKVAGRNRKKRILQEEAEFPGARFYRLFPNKKFDYSFSKSCTISAKKTEERLQMGYTDGKACFGELFA